KVGRQVASALDRFDLPRLERVGKVEGVVSERFIRLDLGQGIELALGALSLLLHPRAQILVALAAATRDEKRGARADRNAHFHFLPFASFADRRCFATSSSSR